MSELPVNWARAQLGDVVDVLDHLRVPINRTERAGRVGPVPYYGATGQVGWIDETLFNEELCLLGEDGAPFFDMSKPKAYVIDGPSWVNNHAHVLRAHDCVTTRFLKYALDQVDYRSFVTGTTRAKLTKSAMSRITFPLPPPAEQRRIVAAIEEQLSCLDAAQTALKSARARATALLHCSLAWDESWPQVQLNELGTIVTGTTPSTKNGAYWGGEVLFVTPGDYEFGERVVSSRRGLTAVGAEAARVVPPRAVLVTCIGATTGKVGLASRDCAINQQVNAVVADTERLLPCFLLLACTRREFQRSVWDAAASTTLPILNKTKFGRLSIPLPPLDDQEAAIRHYERVRVAAAAIEKVAAIGAAKGGRLRKSILARAFRGELVPQDPDDEPASVLLERIAAERATAPTPKRTRAGDARSDNPGTTVVA